MTVLFNEIELKIKVLNEKCKIKKIFGKDKLYKCELTENNLDVRCLQFISGKVYTFTIEVELPDVIPINENILDVEFLGDNHEKINKVVKYSIVVGGFSLADEEYLRCQLFETIELALKLKEENKEYEMKKILNDMKKWIEKNYEGINKQKYIQKINDSLGIVTDFVKFCSYGKSRITADISENLMKRDGHNLCYNNVFQKQMIISSNKNYPRSIPITNKYNK